MNINKLIEGSLVEGSIYGKTVEIPSLGLVVKKYISFEEKFGLANRILSATFDKELCIYDGVNAKFLIPVFFIENYCDELSFPENIVDLDATGVYDYLVQSGALQELHDLLGHELVELESIVDEIVKIEYRKKDTKNPLEDFLGDISQKNPDDIKKMTHQIKDLMKDENVQNMVNFKEQGSS